MNSHKTEPVIPSACDDESDQPLLSICILTYNHVNFIKHAVESVLAQKTDFKIEVCIGEDQSNDGTREICQKYAEQNPEKIRLFLRDRKDNIKIMGRATGRYNMLETVKSARGKYIATLEGDDYWIDPLKCQKQVDILEADKELCGCFTNTEDLFKEGTKACYADLPEGHITKNHFVERCYPRTCSVMFRKSLLMSLPPWVMDVPALDYPLYWYLASWGNWYYLPDRTAVYRVGNGLWSGSGTSFRHAGRLWPQLIGLKIVDSEYKYETKQRAVRSASALLWASFRKRRFKSLGLAISVLFRFPLISIKVINQSVSRRILEK